MCGITGVAAGRAEIDPTKYYIAHRSLRHRGPDDEGFVAFDKNDKGISYSGNSTCLELKNAAPHIESAAPMCCVLGHHRLSILDTSPAGHQPMHHDGLWMVYNGEIYNYRELRDELESKGYAFTSATDSEVVLKAYHCWGRDAFHRFNGMWALAIWNEANQTLLLSRDRFGIKPLYYAIDNGRLYFASEVKFFRSLLRLTPHEARMRDYVEASKLDHEVETMLAPVRQLRAAHYAEYRPDNNRFVETRYWALPDDSVRLTEAEALEQFRELFDSAIDLRLRSDVPLGGLLSGGLDSSAIVSNLASRGRVSQHGLSVFSAVFPGWEESEYDLINETVGRYPQVIPHFVEPTAERLIEDLPKLLYQVDFPIRSSAVHSQSMLYEHVRQQSDIVVLLNGQGADEIFAGYQGQRLPRIASALRRLQLGDAWCESHALAQLKGTATARILNAAVRTLLRHFRYRYLPHEQGVVAASMDANPLTALLRYNLTYASLPEYLRYEDRNSMSVSCETRLPFLDYRLVEWAFRLNDRMKIRNGETKYIQRKAVSTYVPEKIVHSRIKKGFISPQEKWQQGVMKGWLQERIANHGISFLPADLIKSLEVNPAKDSHRWWRIACLAEWLHVG